MGILVFKPIPDFVRACVVVGGGGGSSYIVGDSIVKGYHHAIKQRIECRH